jgi:signal transduction histidine kinase
VYHFKGELREAISFYQEAIIVATQFNSSNSIALCYLNIGEAMLALDDPKTVNTLEKAIEVSNEFGLNRVLLNAHQFLATYYQKHQLYSLAFDHYKSYKKFNDLVLNEGSIAKLNTLNVKFSTAQKEKQIAKQELEIEKKNAVIIRERNQKIAIATGLVFILLIVGFFYFRSQMRQKARVQQAVIQEKELGLKAVFMATEVERQRISKDLHDGVGQQLSGVKMQLESLNVENTSQQEQKERITENLYQASQEIRQISHQLMPRSLEEEGLTSTLEDLFEKTFSGTSINCSFEHHKAEKRYPKEVELSLYRITQELINNILKHANAKNVHVQLYKIRTKLVMTVEDDGVGFDVSEKSEGHGLLNIKSRIETVNGNVEFESSDTSETVITLSIPINTANNG